MAASPAEPCVERRKGLLALFDNAFRYMCMGYASAMAWVLFAIVLALTVVQLKLAPLWVHYESES